MTGTVDAFDKQADALFEHLRGNRLADRVFYTASRIGEHGGIWIVLSALRFLRGGRENRIAGARALVAVFVEAAIVNIGLKSLFRRHRPDSRGEHPYPLREPWTSSFPSGHASAAFCSAVLLSEGDPVMSPLYAALASVIAASRVHVRMHHASDVIGGSVLGLAFGLVGRRMVPLRRR